MTFSFACHQCGHGNHAEFTWAGRTIHCAGCGTKVVVPAPREPAEGSGTGDGAPALQSLAALRFKCPECGRRYAAKPALIGKKIRCGGCGARVAVPGDPIGVVAAPAAATGLGAAGTSSKPRRPPRPPAGHAPADSRFEDEELTELDEVPDDPPPAHAPALPLEPPRLPSRSRRRERGDFDEVDTVLPSRTEAIAELEQELAQKQEEEKKQQAKKARKKKKRRKSSGGLEREEVLTVFGVTVVGIAAVAGLTYGYPGLRFPVGGLVSVCGFILSIFGTYGISQVAGEEGLHYRLLCRFAPFYKWYYILTRWGEMKEHFAFYAVGMMLLWSGGAMLRWSPEYLKSEEGRKAARAAAHGRAHPGPSHPEPPPAAVPAVETEGRGE